MQFHYKLNARTPLQKIKDVIFARPFFGLVANTKGKGSPLKERNSLLGYIDPNLEEGIHLLLYTIREPPLHHQAECMHVST